jgi:hypothetical protein
MNYINNYNNFVINEKFDDNIIAELKRLGVTDKEEINKHLYHAHRGNLSKYLQESGKDITFGFLRAIFLDAQEAKKRTDIRVGVIKAIHRIVPMALSPFFPILAIIGYILGTSRAFNKVIAPILADPGNNYPEFLQRIIVNTMKIAEGEIVPVKDRFSRAFVVSDNITDAIREDVLREFSIYLSNKMSRKDPDQKVPDYYIENQLKRYLNRRYDIDPEIPLKENLNEGVNYSEYKKWSKNFNWDFYNEMGRIFKSDISNYQDNSKNFDRIYFDLKVDSENFEIIIPNEIRDFFNWHGQDNEMEILDYNKGICIDKDGREIRIGRLLRKMGEDRLIDIYNKSKQNLLKNIDDLQVVISRHPYDIIGMSTDRGWTTCLDINDKRYGGEHLHHMEKFLKNGALIAYLIRKNDKNINNPISRILIIKNWYGGVSDEEIYGTYVKEFEDFVSNWCRELNKKIY